VTSHESVPGRGEGPAAGSRPAQATRDRYQAQLHDAGYGTVSTEISDAGPFYYAEEVHQQYLAKNPGGYCNHGFCQVAYEPAS
jgi:peptide-methionine (S)-S-oxide reductase